MKTNCVLIDEREREKRESSSTEIEASGMDEWVHEIPSFSRNGSEFFNE